MNHFRAKLAVILLSSDLNKRKGCPLYQDKITQESNCNTFPEVKVFETPLNSNKMKLCSLVILDDDPKFKESFDTPTLTPVEAINQSADKSQNRYQLSEEDKRALKNMVEEWDVIPAFTYGEAIDPSCTPNSFMSSLSTESMPETRGDMIEFLCEHIMRIQGDTILK